MCRRSYNAWWLFSRKGRLAFAIQQRRRRLGDGKDGASAAVLEELSLVLSLPNFRDGVSAEVVEAQQVIETVARHRPVPVAFVGMQDRFGTSGRWNELLEHFRLTPQAVAEAAREVLSRKGS